VPLRAADGVFARLLIDLLYANTHIVVQVRQEIAAVQTEEKVQCSLLFSKFISSDGVV
jgi:hypothetical protein